MFTAIISAIAAAMPGIGEPPAQTADIECVYEYCTTNEKGQREVYSTILQIGRRSAKFTDYSTFQPAFPKQFLTRQIISSQPTDF